MVTSGQFLQRVFYLYCYTHLQLSPAHKAKFFLRKTPQNSQKSSFLKSRSTLKLEVRGQKAM